MERQFNKNLFICFSAKFIKYFTLILLVSNLFNLSLEAQSKSNTQFISEEKAISIAKRSKLLTSLDPTPSTQLDSAKKIWMISSMKSKHIKNGKCKLDQPTSDTCNCKYTNGCSDIVMKKIRINAINGKVISKRTTRKRYPNYE